MLCHTAPPTATSKDFNAQKKSLGTGKSHLLYNFTIQIIILNSS